MNSTEKHDHLTYRAIVFSQGGAVLLVRRVGDRFLLPSVGIPRCQRLAENIISAVRKEWDIKAICLFNPDLISSVASANRDSYQVLECLADAKSPQHAEWLPVSLVSEKSFVDPADHVAVQRALTACAVPVGAAALGPFARFGWFTHLQAWIAEIIEPLGLYLTGSFSQLNACPSFSLVRFETNGPAVWFKAVGYPNLREFPITLALARLVPRYLPPILATRTAWHGWLAFEAKGSKLGEPRDVQQWARAACGLANLQIESTAGGGMLINAGAHDLRTSALLKLVRPFLDAMGQIMQTQPTSPPLVLSENDLRLLGERIEEALCSTSDMGIPDALGHLDPNPGNVIVSEDHCVFLDWAEAYVGNPLFTLQYLVEHSRRMAGFDARTETDVVKTYTERWQLLVSPSKLREALALAELLAVFVYATASDTWRDQARLQNPKVAGYLRSLTRRMHREGNRLRDRSVPCPS
jgi:hypothetical protein